MPGGQTGQQSIEQLQETAMNVAYNATSVIVMPVEIWLRPWHGTRYFPPPIFLLSVFMMSLASMFLSVAGSVGQMIPFVHLRGPVGLFGIASMTKLFFLASLVHGLRIWRLMVKPQLEENSMFEGRPLPFFLLLPKGNSFWFCRIVYEPLAVFALAIVLGNLFIIQAPLMQYLEVASFCLAMKQYVAWYRNWQLTRNLMDAASAGPIIGRIIDNQASDEDMARVHMASLPANLPRDIREASVAHLAHAYSVPSAEEESHG
jgi:hypothetical protein